MSGFAERLSSIEDRIQSACHRCGRSRSDITLIAVSKNHPIEAVHEAIAAGLQVFGESRVQDAAPKIEVVDQAISWHMIGKLQSNKANRAASLFDAIHTFETSSQLIEIVKQDRIVDGFVEVNIAGEAQKSGLHPELVEPFLDLVLACPKVRFKGLMTIGPLVENPEDMRPYFRKLANLNASIGGAWLSMGMSDDFEIAIDEGATHIRIGTALFGTR